MAKPNEKDPLNVIDIDTGRSKFHFSSGTSVFTGIFNEEYLLELKGVRAAQTYDKMRRGDGQVQMVLAAIKNTLRSANASIDSMISDEDDPFFEQAKEQAEFASFQIFEDLRRAWSQVLDEMFSCVDFGHAVQVMVDKNVVGHPRWGNYTGLDDLCWISPKTIYRWNINPYGRLESIDQQAYGDLQAVATIPGDFLVVTSLQREGDNYEGISVLRGSYGSWWRKNQYLKIQAIGTERNALGIPSIEVPAGKENDPERARAENVLAALSAHQLQWVTMPEGWKFNILESKFAGDQVARVIDQEDQAMARSALANFLNLGQQGSGGAYALGDTQQKLFLLGNQYIANKVCDAFNRVIIPRLIRLNFGPQPTYPQMKMSGLTDRASDEWSKMISGFKTTGILGVWSNQDVSHVRKRVGLLPENPDDPAGGQPAPPSFNTPGKPGEPDPVPPGSDPEPADPAPEPKKLDARPIQLAAKGSAGVKLINHAAESLADVMKSNMRLMGNKLIADLVDAWERLPEGSKPTAVKKVQASGLAQYKSILRNSMLNLATRALNQVKAENPKIDAGKFMAKFSDPAGINGKPPKKKDVMKLPKRVRSAVDTQAGLIVDTQAADLEKAIFFQFGQIEPLVDSAALIEQELGKRMDGVLTATETAAQIAGAKTVNETRHFFFFDEDVFEQFESVTFYNEDPVTEICQWMNGRVFDKNDADSWQYEPPLHYNCKSLLVINENGSGAMDEAGNKTGLVPPPSLRDQVKFSCGCGCKHVDGMSDALLECFQFHWFDMALSSERTSILEYGKKYDNLVLGSIRPVYPKPGERIFVGRLKGDQK